MWTWDSLSEYSCEKRSQFQAFRISVSHMSVTMFFDVHRSLLPKCYCLGPKTSQMEPPWQRIVMERTRLWAGIWDLAPFDVSLLMLSRSSSRPTAVPFFSFFLPFFLKLYVNVCIAYARMCRYACLWVHGGQRRMSSGLIYHLLPYYLATRSLTEHGVRLAACKLQQSPCVCPLPVPRVPRRLWRF